MPPKKKGAAAAKKGGAKVEGEDNEYQEVPAAEVQGTQVEQMNAGGAEASQVAQQHEVLGSLGNLGTNQDQSNLLYLASDQTKFQQGEDLHQSATEIEISGIQGLSEKEKKQLRMARFNPNAPKAALILGGNNPVMSTVEAAQRKKEEEEKRQARAQKFGLVTEQSLQDKMMQRAVKFGLAEPKMRTVTSLEYQGKPALAKAQGKFAKKALKLGYALPSEDDEKKKARAERFGISTGDDQDKLKKRQERFGNTTSSGRIIIDNSGPNRRVREI